MPIKTPQFWSRDKSSPAPLVELALSPISALYQTIHKINQKQKAPYKSHVPVICVGNAVAGGSGKTPTAIALKHLLKNDKPKIHFLTRGYKGSLQSTTIVDFEYHDAGSVGDEAMLLSRHAPTIKSIDRPKGLKIAEDVHSNLVIMDDGLQNNSVEKTISLCVIDGHSGLGNGKTIPAGPLRENLENIFAKTDAFILMNDDKTGIKNTLEAQKPVFHAKIEALAPENHAKNIKIVAFAGLGRPEKFKTTLESLGYEIAGWHPYPDHHVYKTNELNSLKEKAERLNATLITTEKDAARIHNPDILAVLETLPIRVVFEQEDALKAFILELLP